MYIDCMVEPGLALCNTSQSGSNCTYLIYLTALLVLVVILLYRSYANSGSWSPNMESIDELPQQHAIIDTVDDEFVTLSSFKMCKR